MRARTAGFSLVLFEDERASALSPLSLLRPVFDIKTGVFTLREKLERQLKRQVGGGIVRSYLRGGELPSELPGSGTVLAINGRVICSPEFARAALKLPLNSMLLRGEIALALHVEAERFTLLRSPGAWTNAALLQSKLARTECDVAMLENPWDVVGFFERELVCDIERVVAAGRGGNQRAGKGLKDVHIINPRAVGIGARTRVYPKVVINAEKGNVIIGSDCTIMPFSYLEGPCFIGPGSIVKTHASISRTSVGLDCRVAGEIHSSTLHSHVNKQHEGFIGHSYFAPWINIGAGTITSNLKNTYGAVRVLVDGRLQETGLGFLGTIAGDHTKFGINTMLNTGTIIGVGSNVAGGGFPPKRIASFSWDAVGTPVEFDRFVAIASKVMARRGIELTPLDTSVLRFVYAQEMASESRP